MRVRREKALISNMPARESLPRARSTERSKIHIVRQRIPPPMTIDAVLRFAAIIRPTIPIVHRAGKRDLRVHHSIIFPFVYLIRRGYSGEC